MTKGQRCMANTKSGSRCGRWVTDGLLPALCHKHKPNAPAVGVIPPDDQIDEVKILKKLARDANPQVRLRAVDLLLSLKAKTTDQHEPAVDIKRLTADERSRLERLLLAIREVREEVWTRDPQQRPSWAPQPVEAPWPQPPSTIQEAAPVITTQPTVDEPPDEPFRLARHRWPDVGLFEVKGALTHALGDDYAAKILDGTIPYDAARAQHDAAQQHGNGLLRAKRRQHARTDL